MTIIYSVQENDFSVYFARKSEACAHARAKAQRERVEVEVIANEVAKLPRAQLYANLLNNEKWAAEPETDLVFVAKPRGRSPAFAG